jgi:3-hydroxybutyrate dehydrogenase
MLKGRSALITGSTSGIGLGIAERLAKAGADIMLNGLGTPEQIDSALNKIKTYNVKVHYSPANMQKPEEIHSVISEMAHLLGSVDVVVNNAGIQHVESITTFPNEKWDAIIAINLSSAFHTIKAASAHMRQKKWGRIVNIASVHGLVASAYKSAYVAAKHGIIGLTKVAALELAEIGATCNAICPGYVDTPLVRKQIPEQAKSHNITEEEVIANIMLQNHAIKRFVNIGDIAELTLFLCSEAASMITGTTIPIDGGWSAH